jgi:hypothetical protein
LYAPLTHLLRIPRGDRIEVCHRVVVDRQQQSPSRTRWLAAPLLPPLKRSHADTKHASESGLTVSEALGPARKSASGIAPQIVNTDANLAHDQQQADIASGAFEKIPAGFRSEVLWHSRVHDDPGSPWLRCRRLNSGPKRPPATRTRATAGGADDQ